MLGLLFILSVTACSNTPTKDIQVGSDVDPKANFAGYNSYKWIGSASLVKDPNQQWTTPGFDANAEIKYLIDKELRAKGMTEADQNPDVMVVYALGVNMENIEYKESPDTTFKSLEAAPKGALVVMMIDAQTGVVIWASSAEANIQQNTAEVAKKRLAYAVKNMISTIPK